MSAATAKKQAAFNKVKQALYQKGVKFRLIFPVRLQVSYGEERFTFETPEDTHAFYKERLADKDGRLMFTMEMGRNTAII